jgi:hypothetical protein
MDGFDKLTLDEWKQLATRPDNLRAMDSSANRSKGDRSWVGWKQYGTFYGEETRTVMIREQVRLRGVIQDWILEKARGR